MSSVALRAARRAFVLLMLSPVWVQAADAVERDAVFVGGAELERPVNVFVEGRYAGTLTAGAVSRIPYCANKAYAVKLTADAAGGDAASGGVLLGAGRAIPAAYGVGLDGSGQIVVTALDAALVAPSAGSGKEARQVVSRFRRGDCAEAPALAAAVVPPPPVAPVVAAVTPKATTVWRAPGIHFDFGRGAHPGPLFTAEGMVRRLIDDVESRFERVDRVEIRGYSDSEGTEARKQQRSLERARFVALQLQRTGLVAAEVDVQGAADQNPVVTHCSTLRGASLRACNAPNRRVEVVVQGTPR